MTEARLIAGDDRWLRIDEQAHGRVGRELRERGGRIACDVAQVHRQAGERDRTRVGAGQEQEVLDKRGEMVDLRLDVLERSPHGLDRLCSVATEMLEGASDHGERRPQLVAGVGGELALPADGEALGGQRFADRDQRPPRVDGPGAGRHEQGDEPSAHKDGEQDLERSLLGSPVPHHLDDQRPEPRVDPFAQDPDRDADHGPGPHVTALLPGGGRAPVVRQALGYLELPPADRLPVGPHDERERARRTSPEQEPGGRALGHARRVLEDAPQDRHAARELRGPGGLERVGDARVQHDTGCEEHREGDAAAPGHEPPPDVANEPGVGRQRLTIGSVLGRGGGGRGGGDALRHHRGGIRHRAPSRSIARPRRACRAGSGRKRRQR